MAIGRTHNHAFFDCPVSGMEYFWLPSSSPFTLVERVKERPDCLKRAVDCDGGLLADMPCFEWRVRIHGALPVQVRMGIAVLFRITTGTQAPLRSSHHFAASRSSRATVK